VFLFHSVIWALWSKQINSWSLSKVVHQIRNYLYLNFYQDWFKAYGIVCAFRDVTYRATRFLFHSVIWALWSKQINSWSLSKVVHQIRNYLYLNFYQDWFKACGAICVFCNVTTKLFIYLFILYIFVISREIRLYMNHVIRVRTLRVQLEISKKINCKISRSLMSVKLSNKKINCKISR